MLILARFLFVIWICCSLGCGFFNQKLPSGQVPEPADYDHFIKVGGVNYHYTEYPGAGPTVVMQHGFASSTYTWEKAATILNQQGYHVFALDLKGFGWSEKPLEAKYDAVSLMEDVNQWMEALGLSQTIFVGNSLGGAIAVLMSHKYPQRIEKMVLIDAGGYPIKKPMVIKLAQLPLANFGVNIIFGQWFVRKNLKEVMFDDTKVTEERVTAYYQRMCTENALAAQIKVARAVEFNEPNPIIAAAKDNPTPTLILWGQEDQWIPLPVGYRFRQDMRQAILHIIPQCGHIPQEEKPEVTAQLILDFIEGRPIEDAGVKPQNPKAEEKQSADEPTP
ncbi:MAG: alpha/beta hydrolase [Desulfobacteraceae bacterium]|nr:alpha/beta hydrolase [Desulfobacteraceae bacterium]